MSAVRPVLVEHQQQFIDDTSASGAGLVVLSSPPGLGKSTAAVALAARVVGARSGARVLWLTPSILTRQAVERGRAWGLMSAVIDRFIFRELLDRQPKPTNAAAGLSRVAGFCVMSIDLAKAPDVLTVLSATSWDLLVIDEAHRARGRRADAVARLLPAAKLAVLVSATPDLDRQIRLVDALRIEWPSTDTAAVRLRSALAGTAMSIRNVSFRPSQDERALKQAVEEAANRLEAAPRWVVELVRNSGESSSAAVLATAQALEEGLGREDGVPAAIELLVDAPPDEEAAGGWLDVPLDASALEAIGVAAEQAGRLERDTKMSALLDLLEAKPAEQRACVLVEFGATLGYIDTNLREQNVPVVVAHRATSDEALRGALSAFESGGYVLVATWGALRGGAEPAGVTDVIFYDVPRSESDRRELLARCRPLGSVTEPVVISLVSEE